jgi:GTP-binding protein
VRKPMVAIVGRQNVGKSTLLNKVAGKPLAIVEDFPGTTRDRIFASVSWGGIEFILVDTGGLELSARSTLAQAVREQVDAAIAEADVIIFLVDAQDGLVPLDYEIASKLRKVSKPILLVANKADNLRLENEAVEFCELGLGEPLPVSAQHGRGVAELLDRLVLLLPKFAKVEIPPAVMKVAIVGHPGVGKSMLLNALVGRKRAIVGDVPGTTRDAIDTLIDFGGKSVLLIDTAGVRRRGRIGKGIEQYSVIRTFQAIDRADIALLVLDAAAGITAQDMHIAGYIKQAAKGIVIIVNKWDLMADKDKTGWDTAIKRQFKFMPYASCLYISAKYKQGVDKVIPQAFKVYSERLKKLSAREVSEVVQQAVASHFRPRRGKKELRIFRTVQSGVNPPTFEFSVNETRLVHFSYQRYLENRLRQAFGFAGTPIRLVFKTGGDR